MSRHAPAPGRRRALAAIGWGALALGFAPRLRAGAPRRFGGTFIQPLDRHRQWGDEEWSRLFEAFAALELRELVVQWAVHEHTALFAGGSPEAVPGPLEPLLAHAQRAGMSVLLGLVYDPAYWSEEARRPERLPALFDTLYARSSATARALLPLVARHPAVRGWYICEEVDDLSWDEARRPHLFAYLARLSETLHGLAPGCHIALSGFTDARSQPPAVEAFWRELLAAVPAVDRVLFQDGVGVAKLGLAQLDERLGAVARAARAQRRELSIVVETFRQTAGQAAGGAPFAAAPAPLARLLAQIEAASAHSASLLAFSVPEYMSPLGGEAAHALYRDYLAQLGPRHAR